MTYQGTVKNGVVVLDAGAALQDGTTVRVEPVDLGRATIDRGSARAIMQRAGLWSDQIFEVDHELRGLAELKQQEMSRQVDETL
jgi:hypothetical protein